MELKDLPKKFQKGFKIDYSKIRKAVMKCELEKDKQKCKAMFKEMGIEIYEDD